jgi:NADPH-dependent curcumin reductase
MNQQMLIDSRPAWKPIESNFAFVETAIPEPGGAEVPNCIIYLSLAPYMRGRMSDRHSYAAPVELGNVIGDSTISQVVKSNHP